MASIPQPPTIPILGNAHIIDKEVPLYTLLRLAKEYGPIYQLTFPGPRTSLFVSNLELVDQICDQKRFHKYINSGLKEVRHLTGDGLFTAFNGEAGWGIAHRILMPAFGPAKIRDMFPGMMDIAAQLLAKWEFGPDYAINAHEEFTRLTFDTIALCAMSYRLNSFYSQDMVPFIRAMGSFLLECDARSRRPALVQNYLSRGANAQFEADISTMMVLTRDIIQKRKQGGDDIDDLLGLMLAAKDPVTGQGMTDESIAQNLVTFMIAGHETTSGLLSFAVCHLLDNPYAYAKVRAEVDQVLGDEPIAPGHLGKFPYITAVLRETLRFTPSIPVFTVGPYGDQTIVNDGVEYLVPEGTPISIIVPQLHKDTKVWGDDVNVFRPERMLDGGFERAPPNAWKPWGNGVRSCIGRPFAWQEAIICLACIFQKFDLVHNDPSYKLHLKQTLTVKPRDFFFRTIPRNRGPSFTNVVSPTTSIHSPISTQPPSRQSTLSGGGVPLYLAYGSNSGTCKDFAQRLACEAPVKGFASHLVTLDSIETAVPTDGPVIVLTASYEGEPADNARRFVETLRSAKPGGFANVRFSVFGCGHHDWVQTYQKIPKFIDQVLGECGGQRLMDRQEADSGSDDFFDTFDNWVPKLWEALGNAYGDRVNADGEAGETLSIEMISDSRPMMLKRDETSHVGKILVNRRLTPPGVSAKHHIEIELPEGMTYEAGDYLSILPRNPVESITRVLSRFHLLPDQNILIKSKSSTVLPTNKPVSVWDVLAGYVEIGQTATRKNILDLMKFAPEDVVAKLKGLLDNYKDLTDRHMSVLDILEDYPEIDMPLSSFLSLLPTMRIRQYSISSSPLWNDRHVTITLSVVEIPARDGKPNKFLGVASNYLAKVRPGDLTYVGVRSSAGTFHLPVDPTTRVVMFAAGSGIAPMRGFIQERVLQAKSGRPMGKTVLFYGCRAPDQDFLYSEDDLKEWQECDFLEVKPAFSRAPEKSLGNKYVQDRVWYERDLITDYYEAGAKFFTCGSPAVANGLKETLLRLIQLRQPTWDEEQVALAWQQVQKDRLATDVFA